MLVKGSLINLEKEIPLRLNQTISKRMFDKKNLSIYLFSMYKDTNISAEFYNEYKIYFVLKGEILIKNSKLKENEFFVCEPMKLFDITANKSSVFMEITIKGDEMKNLEKCEIISLKDKIDYVDGGISNLDIVSKQGIKMMLMAFDENQGLRPHSAPGDALVVPLEGKARVMVDEKEFEISVGEQIIFPKNIIHNVTAITKFKMMLILVVD